MDLGGWENFGKVQEAVALPVCGCEAFLQVGLGAVAGVPAN